MKCSQALVDNESRVISLKGVFLKNRTFYIVLNRDTPKKIDKYLWELFNVLHKIRMENPIETFEQNQMLMGTEKLRR